jgi:hypothetical protein
MVLFNSLYLHISNIMFYSFRKIILLLVIASATAQVENEIPPPFNIKTVSFIQNDQNVIPIFSLGSGFQLQFDDLYGNEANFYYEIIHCDYNWKSEIPKTNICKVLTIRGFRITPTLSTHYNCTPIIHCQFLISLHSSCVSAGIIC